MSKRVYCDKCGSFEISPENKYHCLTITIEDSQDVYKLREVTFDLCYTCFEIVKSRMDEMISKMILVEEEK